MLNPTLEQKKPYLIKDNFLRPDYLDYAILAIAKEKNSPVFSREGYEHKKSIRDNFDPRYCDTQLITNPRNVLYSIFDRYFWNEMFEELSYHEQYIYRHGCHSRTGKVLLSCYGNTDYYGLHVDNDMGSVFTAVLMLHFPPDKLFSGGDLQLEEDVIPFENNRLVMFPSCMMHGVTKIEMDSDEYTHKRFSLQYFVSATPFKPKLIDESSNIE